MQLFDVFFASAISILSHFGWATSEQPVSVPQAMSQQMTTNTVQFSGKEVGTAPVFSAIKDVTQKKQSFFDYLRPGIELENQRIQKERARLEEILADHQQNKITSEDISYAKRLGRLYNLEVTNDTVTAEWLTEMLHRVNVLPESLVMVQAANESAWGTSRFATKANNYFGQWCYQKGCGLVPLQRNAGSTHEVAKFTSVQESIHRYFMNVNRNRAYQDLREIRFELQENGKSLIDPAAGTALTNGLLKYSERGQAYINDLQAMIRHNAKFWKQY